MKQQLLLLMLCLAIMSVHSQKIDRKALVTRHNIVITDRNIKGPTQVGNGKFAYGFDITGLQTFNDGATTMSDWGWHEFSLPKGQKPEDFKGQMWDTQGRMVRYDINNPDQPELTQWMIQNPHRLNLGRIGLILKKKDGSLAKLEDLQQPEQRVDLWTGTVVSVYSIDGEQIKVTTVGHPSKDAVAIKIQSKKVADGSIGVFINFPYAASNEFGNGADWNNPEKHQTEMKVSKNQAIFKHTMDATVYYVRMAWNQTATLKETKKHFYELTPNTNKQEINLVICFDKTSDNSTLPTFAQTQKASAVHWEAFWKSGGAIDLSESKDPRWFELERRIVLSQYIMAINEVGTLPPQESGLVNNGWWGKYHYEMIWWHCAHYALWDRWPLVNKMLEVYRDNLEIYKKKAAEQGYKGVRWPKTIGDHAWWEWPNEINPLLIWQQPHPVFFAELDYRAHPNKETLNKWKDVVFETADFMASYAYFNKREDRYILGYPLQVVSENARPQVTYNPTFELSYWRFGLHTAQLWRERLGLSRDKKWDDVLKKLSPLPQVDGVYVQWENIHDMWNHYNWGHPALIGAFGMLPGDGVDTATMERTLMKAHKMWRYETTWGWDFPMLAMCAAKLGHQDMAIDFLLNYNDAFNFDVHGLVGGGSAVPFPYFPGNGGLLYAVALMAAGWDGAPDIPAPGFPQNDSWVVKMEGLKKAL